MPPCQVDTYIDSYLPVPDAQVAACLSGPLGPCRYKKGWEMTEDFLLHLVPGCNKHFSCQVALTFALPFLWAVSHTTADTPLVPADMKARIVAQCQRDLGEINMEELVTRVPLAVGGSEGMLVITELNAEDIENGQVGNKLNIAQQFAALHSEIRQMRAEGREIEAALTAEILRLSRQSTEQYTRLNQNIRRIAIQPVVRPQAIINDNLGAPGALPQ